MYRGNSDSCRAARRLSYRYEDVPIDGLEIGSSVHAKELDLPEGTELAADVARRADAVPALERVLHGLYEGLDDEGAEKGDRWEQQQVAPEEIAATSGAGPEA